MLSVRSAVRKRFYVSYTFAERQRTSFYRRLVFTGVTTDETYRHRTFDVDLVSTLKKGAKLLSGQATIWRRTRNANYWASTPRTYMGESTDCLTSRLTPDGHDQRTVPGCSPQIAIEEVAVNISFIYGTAVCTIDCPTGGQRVVSCRLHIASR
jgi:hypothetical protein